MENSDQRKYGSVMQNHTVQYSLGNNQYYEDINNAKSVLGNHQWDSAYKENKKRRRQQQEEAKQ